MHFKMRNDTIGSSRGANNITRTRDFSVQFRSNQNERNILNFKKLHLFSTIEYSIG